MDRRRTRWRRERALDPGPESIVRAQGGMVETDGLRLKRTPLNGYDAVTESTLAEILSFIGGGWYLATKGGDHGSGTVRGPDISFLL